MEKDQPSLLSKLRWLNEDDELAKIVLNSALELIETHPQGKNLNQDELVQETLVALRAVDEDQFNIQLYHLSGLSTSGILHYIGEECPENIYFLLEYLVKKFNDPVFNSHLVNIIDEQWLIMKAESTIEFIPRENESSLSYTFLAIGSLGKSLVKLYFPSTDKIDETKYKNLKSFAEIGYVKYAKFKIPSETLDLLSSPLLRSNKEQFKESRNKLRKLIGSPEIQNLIVVESKFYERSIQSAVKKEQIKIRTIDDLQYFCKILKSAISELFWLHDKNITHGGITPGKLLLRRDVDFKYLIRFHAPGLSCRNDAFTAPDSFPSIHRDIYSLGLVMVWTLSNGNTSPDSVDFTTVPFLPRSRTLFQLISSMVEPSLEKRIKPETFQTIVNNIDWDELEMDLNIGKSDLIGPRTQETRTIARLSNSKISLSALNKILPDIKTIFKENQDAINLGALKEYLFSPLHDMNQIEAYNELIETIQNIDDLVDILFTEWPQFIGDFLIYLIQETSPFRDDSNFKTKLLQTINEIWLENFHSPQFIAKGAFGYVVKVAEKDDASKCALKLIFPFEDEIPNISRELESLKYILHPNIMMATHWIESREFTTAEILRLTNFQREPSPIEESSCDSDADRIAMALAESALGPVRGWIIAMPLYHKSLESWLNETFLERKNLQKSVGMVQLRIIRGLMRGLRALQSYRILHRDLKPDNVLFSGDDYGFPVRIVDLGLSRILSDEDGKDSCFSDKGNLRFKAPETMDGKPATLQAEIFSLGMLLLVVLLPVEGNRLRHVGEALDKIKIMDNNGTNLVSQEGKILYDSVLSMIRFKVKERMSCEEFMTFSVNWDAIRNEDCTQVQVALKKNIDPEYFKGSCY